MAKSRWITLSIAVIVMLGATWFFDSEPKRFVTKPSNTIQIDTIGIRRSEFASLLTQYFGTRTNLQATVDSTASDSYSVRISGIGNPAAFLSKNYTNMLTATRMENGFEVKLEGIAPPYDLILAMNADNEFVVVPAGVLAMLMD